MQTSTTAIHEVPTYGGSATAGRWSWCHRAVVLVVAGLGLWTPASSLAADNIASGKPYELSPAPNYKLTTDPADSSQLTDGAKRGAGWRDRTTVGWRDPANPPTITIDLGGVQSIAEVRIHTVGGGFADVFHPEQVLVMVSDDGRTFHPVGLLADTGPELVRSPRRAGLARVLRLERLATRGRFVQVTLVPHKRYVFLDELQVFAGRHDPASVVFPTERTAPAGATAAVLAGVRHARRMRTEIDRLTLAETERPTPELAGKCEALKDAAAAASVFAVEAWDAIEQHLGRLRARRLAGTSLRRLPWRQVRPMDRWGPYDILDAPVGTDERFHFELWQGEYESGAIEVVNTSGAAMRVRVSVSPMKTPTGADLDWRDTLTLRRAAVIETLDGRLIGDPLVRLVDATIPIDAGTSAQLWLTAHNRTLPAGEYRFMIRLEASADRVATIPMTMVVHPIRFPVEVSLNTATWAYPEKLGLSRASAAKVGDDLRAHYVNAHVVPGSSCPKAFLGRDGQWTYDFRRMRESIALMPSARTYLLFWAMTPPRLDTLGKFGEWMSPEWRAHMRRFLAAWVAELRSLGVGYDRFVMYPFDESLCDEFFELAKFIKECDPKIRLFANSAGDRRGDSFDRFIGLIDIWCLPEARPASVAARKRLHQRGVRNVWRYATEGNAKTLAPYAYYRLKSWHAWADGDIGCGFWTYAGRRAAESCSGWDDATCLVDRWSVVYLGRGAPIDCSGEVVVPSRRWEAWREGVEDHEYLAALRSAISAARADGCDPARVARAAATLRSVVDDVLGNESETQRADDARRRITDAILSLRRAGGEEANGG